MANAVILEGRKDAEDMRDTVAARVRSLRDYERIRPGLAIIRVGDTGETKTMLDQREQWALDAGFLVNRHDMPQETTTRELLLVVEGMNDDSNIHGVVILEPMPQGIDIAKVRGPSPRPRM